MLKSTNPNPHGHDNLGMTGVRDDKIGLGVLSGDNDIVRYLILCFIQQYCFTLHGKVFAQDSVQVRRSKTVCADLIYINQIADWYSQKNKTLQ